MPFADSDGVRIRYEVTGAGIPLLLIMGYGMPSAMWATAMPYFAEAFQPVWFDTRGTGESDVPEEGYDLPHFARDARAVMDALGWESAHLYGVSLGSTVALQVALDAPERVRSLVLGPATSGKPEPTPEQTEALREYSNAVRSMETDPEGAVARMLPFYYPPEYLAQHPEFQEMLLALMKAQPFRRGPDLSDLAAVLRDVHIASRLGEITCPTLVMHGSEDRLIPVSHALALFESLPRVELRLFKPAAHSFTHIDRDGIMRSIAGWIARREAERQGSSDAGASVAD